MSKFSKAIKLLFNPSKLIVRLNEKKLGRLFSDKFLLKHSFKYNIGKKLNLKAPTTFNEKLQWLKLYNRNPEYTRMVDKYEIKGYITEKIGEQYVIPLLGVWDKFEDIDFDSLPNQFVLKTTHGCGGFVICKDKANFDIEEAKNKLNRSLKRNYYLLHREWPYKNVKPRIIAEKYMVEIQKDGQECLSDYKFFCFNGKVKLFYIANEKANPPTTDFFDVDFNHLEMRTRDKNADIMPEKPEKFDEMKKLAEKLSEGIPFVRVDFYCIDGQIYLGEFTFFHNAGLCTFKPPIWDETLGSWLILPEKR